MLEADLRGQDPIWGLARLQQTRDNGLMMFAEPPSHNMEGRQWRRERVSMAVAVSSASIRREDVSHRPMTAQTAF